MVFYKITYVVSLWQCRMRDISFQPKLLQQVPVISSVQATRTHNSLRNEAIEVKSLNESSDFGFFHSL